MHKLLNMVPNEVAGNVASFWTYQEAEMVSKASPEWKSVLYEQKLRNYTELWKQVKEGAEIYFTHLRDRNAPVKSFLEFLQAEVQLEKREIGVSKQEGESVKQCNYLVLRWMNELEGEELEEIRIKGGEMCNRLAPLIRSSQFANGVQTLHPSPRYEIVHLVHDHGVLSSAVPFMIDPQKRAASFLGRVFYVVGQEARFPNDEEPGSRAKWNFLKETIVATQCFQGMLMGNQQVLRSMEKISDRGKVAIEILSIFYERGEAGKERCWGEFPNHRFLEALIKGIDFETLTPQRVVQLIEALTQVDIEKAVECIEKIRGREVRSQSIAKIIASFYRIFIRGRGIMFGRLCALAQEVLEEDKKKMGIRLVCRVLENLGKGDEEKIGRVLRATQMSQNTLKQDYSIDDERMEDDRQLIKTIVLVLMDILDEGLIGGRPVGEEIVELLNGITKIIPMEPEVIDLFITGLSYIEEPAQFLALLKGLGETILEECRDSEHWVSPVDNIVSLTTTFKERPPAITNSPFCVLAMLEYVHQLVFSAYHSYQPYRGEEDDGQECDQAIQTVLTLAYPFIQEETCKKAMIALVDLISNEAMKQAWRGFLTIGIRGTPFPTYTIEERGEKSDEEASSESDRDEIAIESFFK